MNLKLTRKSYLKTGIFGELEPEDESFTLYTLEHAFPFPDGIEGFYAKIRPGAYKCVRWLSPKHGYELFILLGVPDHEKCEIHIGCYNKDSDGCILVGLFRSGDDCIFHSKDAFNLLMKAMTGVNEFTLTII